MKMPYINSLNMVGIRYFSYTNTWLDFVVFVTRGNEGEAQELIREAMDDYWDNKHETYGEALEEKLYGMTSLIVYHDTEDESDEYENEWNDMVDGMDIVATINS